MTNRSVAHYTFVTERTFSAPPALVFAAFADPAKKARWCCHENWECLLMDFRVGGREISRGSEPGGPVYAFDGLYQDIVTGERIIFAYTMDRDGARVSASTATIELRPDGAGAHLVFTDQGAYLDGLASPEDRERGTSEGLDNLTRFIADAAGRPKKEERSRS